MVPLRARVDLEVIEMKRYSGFIKVPTLLEPHYQIVQCHIHSLGEFCLSAEMQSVHSNPQPSGLVCVHAHTCIHIYSANMYRKQEALPYHFYSPLWVLNKICDSLWIFGWSRQCIFGNTAMLANINRNNPNRIERILKQPLSVTINLSTFFIYKKKKKERKQTNKQTHTHTIFPTRSPCLCLTFNLFQHRKRSQSLLWLEEFQWEMLFVRRSYAEVEASIFTQGA